MTKPKPSPEKSSNSRKPRRRVLLNDSHDASAVPAVSDSNSEGAMAPSQSSSSGGSAYPFSTIDQDDDALDVGLLDDHPAIQPFYDGAEEADRVGYKKPPKKYQFPKGTSGNPSGIRTPPIMQPGAINSLIGKTILEEISGSLSSPVRCLEVLDDDNGATALAKRLVTDAIKGEGRSRTLVMNYYVEPQRAADRYQQLDHGAVEAKMLGEMARVIMDPTITDDELSEKMERWARTKEEIATFQVGPLDELPPLPKPKKPRKASKAKRRTKPTTLKPSGGKN